MPRILFKIAGVALVIASFAVGWVLLDYRAFLADSLNVEEGGSTYIVAPGSSLGTLARGLAQRGIIEHPRYLVLLGRLQGMSQDIKVGEYLIPPGTTPAALLQMLVAGKVTLYSFTIVEGWSFRQLMDSLRQHEQLLHTLQDIEDTSVVMQRLGLDEVHPEGRFFPETYRFPKGTTDVDFLRRAYLLGKQRLEQEWEQRDPDLPLASPYEALILASIIEKETAVADEREQIAGVFVRRLKRSMRLQTDPTVIYGMGDSYQGNIRRSDLLRDTPYNTYTRSGLPPTPIALPGGDAIHAALHPAPGDTLFFVSRGDGTHQFSATLQEHNQAVVKYQLKGKVRSFSSSP